MQRILEELKFKTNSHMKLFCDNKIKISITHNPMQHDCTKHLEIDRRFTKEKLDSGMVCMPFMSTKQQIADVLTKSLFKLKFESLVMKLGMTKIYAPT